MGWTWRKSFNLGPFRINVSRSGISYSVGLGGFRYGVDTKGRTYNSVNVPGTGLNYRNNHGTKSRKKSTKAETPPEESQ